MVAAFQANKFSVLDQSIEESFLSIDRFEFQIADELKTMRDEEIFKQGGYTSFEQYCEERLSRWGGYRRVNQLIGAQMVVNALKGTEFEGAIKRESHARPLLRLVKQPEKLVEAVALACQDSPTPIANNFKEAANSVDPKPKRTKVQEQLFLKGTKVKISSPDHNRNGEECVIAADAPNHWQQIVEFSDGERTTIHNKELDAPSSPYPPERRIDPKYQEAIAQLEEQHRQEIARLEQEIECRIRGEAEQKAIASLHDQIKAAQDLANQKALEVAKLQRQLVEMESLRQLEIENKSLRDRIGELERALEDRPLANWGNTFTKQAEKVLNAQVKKVVENLEPELHLKAMAKSAPENNPRETVTLLGLSLVAMSNGHPRFAAELRKAAAIVLGVGESELETKKQQLEQLPSAVASLKLVLQNPRCTWEQVTIITNNCHLIKQEIWVELSPQERQKIDGLKGQSSSKLGISDRVSHSDKYQTRYQSKGTIIGIESEMYLVQWDGEKHLFQHRYEESELRKIYD
ncbi:hypothetical protein [Aulosira sp. FACHB-615]|uniref:hypothetical protein n=1 Tax=Aulosira sp. FACHB-615 TaxID=2692777 RepID=UPI001683EFAA|nr:hypothetical protein [Aulosira sp. FACHB-615]MBD2492598.1 hypothetical protein [Aulosira sp. FACHB-615]